MGGRAEDFHSRTHLRRSGPIAHVSGYHARGCLAPSRKSHGRDKDGDEYQGPESSKGVHPTIRAHHFWETRQQVYSTAKVAVGSTVCLDSLSFTLISILYRPTGRFAAESVFCNVTWSPTLPIVSVESTVWMTALLLASVTLYSNVADGLCVFS